jgi:HD-like signal output (HDOD) protein
MAGIPSLSLPFFEVMKLFNADKPDLDKIAKVVAMDLGMSSTVLHFVNSGYFGFATLMSNPERAVRWLGLETVRNLIVKNRLSSSLDTQSFEYFDVVRLWSNSLSIATSARAVAMAHSSHGVLADDAFAAGMFHDVGQVVLASVLGNFYDSVIAHAINCEQPLWQAELEMIGSTHAEVGAYLLGLWGMPVAVVDAVARHHCSSDETTEEFTALTALQIADAQTHGSLCEIRS